MDGWLKLRQLWTHDLADDWCLAPYIILRFSTHSMGRVSITVLTCRGIGVPTIVLRLGAVHALPICRLMLCICTAGLPVIVHCGRMQSASSNAHNTIFSRKA